MPSNWLTVPHFQQELDSACVAACARMVLAHYGDVRSEADLRSLLDTQPTGTRAGNLMRLSGPTFEVYLRPSNFAELKSTLANNQPVIVFLKTGALKYWPMDIFHTAVLIGLDETTVALHDPYFGTGPQSTSLQSFEKAWATTGQFAAFIRPRRKP
jgi:ABC-type bacteriocin/lantibiotic exporter with double-glycine peptidase domain